MDVKQLTAVVTVAETGSVTRAAELLHTVQSAVTRQIRGVEDELGVALFHRTRQGMQPTEAGTALIARARRVLTELERARAELQQTPDRLTGIVTVGILGSALEVITQPLVHAVAQRFPGLELRLATGYSGNLQHWLDAGELDVSLLYTQTSSPSAYVRPIVEDHLWAVAPAGAGLRLDQPVDLATVLGQPFVMPISGVHGLRILIDQARLNLDIEPKVTAQANDIVLQKSLVKAGLGWTILPAVGVAADAAKGIICAAPIRDHAMTRTIAIGLHRRDRIAPAVNAVAAELARVIRTAVRKGAWPAARIYPLGVNDSSAEADDSSPAMGDSS